jgi:hypothetical protein
MTTTSKMTIRPFHNENGDLYGEVISIGYSSPYRVGDKILQISKAELDKASQTMNDLKTLSISELLNKYGK